MSITKELYADATGIVNPISIVVSSSHGSSATTAVIQCEDVTGLDIGSEITIDLGYTDDYGRVFTGYVKQLDHQVKDDIYSITAMDKLIRAVDYFIVSSSPDDPYDFGTGISAEDLVNQVIALCGLSLTYIDPTSFTFGVSNPVEVNLVSCFDYCRMIGDVVTWNLWCDQNGLLHFENRKPFFMLDEPPWNLQVGWDPDTAFTTINTPSVISTTYKRSEKDLRNRVVVFGGGGISSTSDSATSYDPFDNTWKVIMPANYYKSIVCSYAFIDTQSLADELASYNLELYNRVKDSVSATVLGNYQLYARKAIAYNDTVTGITGNFYILSCEHTWSKEGFQTTMELAR